ncbi:hypothetical protein O181_058181 [Austropuccinia psidii MF-1]|uniref:Uncharacterized protein n=1 Tax=Austropuccinia psidii MF-1 TaxID=1389203 RepID=A0A9Q3EGJ4_9BASI|nr:hypothetical protein [Austropuccinia psidii MF-1]
MAKITSLLQNYRFSQRYLAILLKSLASSNPKHSQRRISIGHRLGSLSQLLSDARTTYRLWDLLSIFQWLRSLNALSISGSKLIQIERLQVISMLIYYPLEHLYFLASKQIIPIPKRIINKVALYSCRAWAAYTLLHFFHLREDLILLNRERERLKSLSMSGSYPLVNKSETALGLKRIEGRRAALLNGLVINLAYLPLTVHWSLPNEQAGKLLLRVASCFYLNRLFEQNLGARINHQLELVSQFCTFKLFLTLNEPIYS